MMDDRAVLEARDGWGPWPRFTPLAAGALFLGIRLLFFGTPWGSTLEYAAWGFGSLAAAALVHLLALRLPERYAVDGAAWALTILAGSLLTVMILAGGN